MCVLVYVLKNVSIENRFGRNLGDTITNVYVFSKRKSQINYKSNYYVGFWVVYVLFYRVCRSLKLIFEVQNPCNCLNMFYIKTLLLLFLYTQLIRIHTHYYFQHSFKRSCIFYLTNSVAFQCNHCKQSKNRFNFPRK